MTKTIPDAKIIIYKRLLRGMRPRRFHFIRLDNCFTLCGIDANYRKMGYAENRPICKHCIKIRGLYSHFKLV